MRNRHDSGRASSAALASLLTMVCCACTASGTEVRRLMLPDQFHLTYSNGRGDIDSKLDSTRGFNEEGSVIAFGLSWNLAEERGRDDALRRDDMVRLIQALREDLRPQAPEPVAIAAAVEPEPVAGSKISEPEPIVTAEPPEPESEPLVEEPLLVPVEPEPREEPAPTALFVALEEPPALLAPTARIELPRGILAWWPVAALATGLTLAFAVYSAPVRGRIVRDRRATLASRAR